MFKLQNPSHTWCLRYYPSKHARSDPEMFWLQPVMASMQPESGQIVYTGSHFLHLFQLFFRRRPGSYCAKMTQIRSGWCGQGLAKCIWPGSKLVCRHNLAWFLAGHNWPATSFPLSDLVPLFHRRPR